MSTAWSNERVSLQLKWTHSFQFAGYYMAKELGFYREAGLDVTLKEYTSGMDVVKQVMSGQAEYGVGTSSLLISRYMNQPVVVLAPIFQHSPLVIIVPKKSDIQSIHALSGKRIMIDPLSHELLAYLSREGIPRDKFTLVNNTSIQQLQDGHVDAAGAYISEQPFILNQAHFSYELFSPRSAGIDFYGDNLFTSQNELSLHPERVKAFLQASLKGWEYAMSNRSETIDLIEQKYGSTKSRAGLEYEAAQIANLVSAEQIKIGYMYPGRWEHIAKVYAETKTIPENFSLNGFLYDPNPVTDHRKIYFYLSLALAIAMVLGLFAAYVTRKNRQLHLSLQTGEQLRENQAHMLIMLEHELRNPMAVLRIAMTSPSIIPSTRELGDRTIQEMEDLLQNCMQMDQLDQKTIPLNLQKCDLLALVNEICIKKNYTEYIAVHTDPASLDYSASADKFLLKAILTNLIDNAIKYTKADSIIDIRLSESISPAQENKRTPLAQRGVLIAIENYPGPAGFPDSKKVFTKFYRAPETHSKIGSGLGLYLVKGMCEKINAYIRYVPLTKLVRFELWLPH